MNQGICKVLVVEDNPSDAYWFEHALAQSDRPRWRPTVMGSLQDAIRHLENNTVDLIVLDLGLPDSRGLQTLENIRGKAPDSPVVVWSGISDDELALRAIESGAQDFLVKDNRDPQKFLRSLNFAFLRHRQGQMSDYLDLSSEARLHLVSQSLEIRDPTSGQYVRKSLTPFEFKLLAYFARHAGRTLSRSEILHQLRGEEFQHYTERTIDVHISTLKQKYPLLKDLIRSVYGMGYVFGGPKH